MHCGHTHERALPVKQSHAEKAAGHMYYPFYPFCCSLREHRQAVGELAILFATIQRGQLLGLWFGMSRSASLEIEDWVLKDDNLT